MNVRNDYRGFVRVRGAREHNLKNVDLQIPREALVVFTGISGSGKSSLAFGTLYAEAQRRYLESVAPYARRLFDQMSPPEVDEIEGLPPAVALQQQRGSPTTRSSVGSVTTLSNLLRMLYSRAGVYPPGQPHLEAESFSTNTPEGACPNCQGLGRLYEVTEQSMVPDPSLTIRERAIAAWPPAWHGQNLRDMLVSMGFDVDKPWRELPKKDRDWILFTEEQPVVPVYAGYTPAETRRALKRGEEPSYLGNFSSARRFVLQTFAGTHSALIKKRVSRYLVSAECRECHGKRLRKESLSVKFAGLDIAEMSRVPLKKLASVLRSAARTTPKLAKEIVAQRIVDDFLARVSVMLELGLGYLTLERSTPTLSPGELQRLRLATQVRSNLFGVVYVLDEPTAGLHPSDTEALLEALESLRASGNSLFVVEHDLAVVRKADWIVDVGPLAGEQGGRILYSGELEGLRQVEESCTRKYLFASGGVALREPRQPRGWLCLSGITRNNLDRLDVRIPLGVLTSVTGISGSGKSSLISQALVELVSARLGHSFSEGAGSEDELLEPLERGALQPSGGHIASGLEHVKRLVRVDQKAIGRTPRSNLATYTGLFDHVRKLFAQTKAARARHYDAGRFSFNVAKGRCETCEGEGSVMVELLFLPSVYAPCPACRGARYNEETLQVRYREKNIAEVLGMTVDAAFEFFAEEPALPTTGGARRRGASAEEPALPATGGARRRGAPAEEPALPATGGARRRGASADEPAAARALSVLREVGLGYLRLGQPATELSGGEAQRIKLATELQRQQRGFETLYVLDEPTTGLHPADIDKLVAQLERLVDAGNTVLVVEHDMRVVAASDWVIDMGPGAGDEGGRIVAEGPPRKVAKASGSRTAPYLAQAIG